MSLVDPAKCVHWALLDPTKPPGIHEPKRVGDVGWDLEAMEDVEIPPMEKRDVPVNARIHLPDGVWAQIHNRSSMGKRDLYVDQNIIDTGYRGPLFVLVRNMQLPGARPSATDGTLRQWDQHVTIRAGERVGQLLFYNTLAVKLELRREISLASERGEAGFGSTGR